jgi:hypothetical protein
MQRLMLFATLSTGFLSVLLFSCCALPVWSQEQNETFHAEKKIAKRKCRDMFKKIY